MVYHVNESVSVLKIFTTPLWQRANGLIPKFGDSGRRASRSDINKLLIVNGAG